MRSHHLVGLRVPAGSRLTNSTILVAGGTRNAARTLRRALEADGCAVHVAAQYGDVLPALSETRPDLLILDAQPSRAACHDLCVRIKRDASLGFVPIAVLDETDADWWDDEDGLEPDAVLLTPVNLDELRGTLQALLRFKRQFDRLHPARPPADRAHEIEVLRSDIIRTVSHELFTPLLQVKTAVTLLTDEDKRPPEGNVDALARKSVARLESVVDNIRQLAQAHNLDRRPFIVGEALALALRYLERSWMWHESTKRIELQNAAEDAIVQGDLLGTARLLQLLLDNALKFSPPDSPVILCAARTGERKVWLAVQDFGIGIAPDEHARIFEVFYQVDHAISRRYGGAGTGLALAMLLADGMETAIELDSTPGEGSTFSFTLPIAPSDD